MKTMTRTALVCLNLAIAPGDTDHAVADMLPKSCSTPALYDDFSGSSFNSDIWAASDEKKLPPYSAKPKRVPDLQLYLPSALKTGPGGLKIEVSSNTDPSTARRPFISGRLVTKRTFLYGYFEFEARLPKGRGLWPALWLRTPTRLPLNGEIDVLEGYGSKPAMIESTLHPWKNGVQDRSYCGLLSTNSTAGLFNRQCERTTRIQARDLSQSFHTYAMLWQSDKVTWLFDGQPYYSINVEIPDQPMIIVMNLQINPHHDGMPDSSAILSQSLDVRHVKVCSQ